MWVFRETVRLLEKVAIAVVAAIVFAEARALVSGANTMHTFQVSLIVMGALLLMMGAMGPGSTYERRVSAVGRYWGQRAGVREDDVPEGRVLTAGAVFVLAGLIVLVIGFSL